MDVNERAGNDESSRAAKGRSSRQALLASARREFARRGYAETSVADIVGQANLTKGAFYHHFAGKEDVFLRVFEAVKAELSRKAFVVHLEPDPYDAPEASQRAVRPFAEQSNAEVWRQLLDSCRRYLTLHADPDVRRIVLVDARWVLSWTELQRVEQEHGVVLLRADLRRAMQRGLVRRLPLRPLAAILAGALNEACLMVANASEPQAALEAALSVIEALLAGVRAADA
jgi:AcrR family transcriptional regulator